MKALASWLSAAARREARRPSLFDALLSGRIARYAYQRLRFGLPRTLLGLVLHAAEVYLLSLALPWEYFAPLLTYRGTAALIAGSHWGALEALRRRVRDELGARHPERARRVIEAWLFASSLAVSLSSVALATLLVLRFEDEGFSLFDAYGVACFVRLALELVTSTYHSGIYASRRVYRPLSASVVPDLLELVALVLLWRPMGAWGIALSIVVTASLRNLLTWHYAARAYNRSRMGRPRLWRGVRALWLLSRADLQQAALHAVSNGGSQLDALLLLVLARAEATPESGFTLGLVYAFRPLLSLAHSWPRAFYPDLKLVERGMRRVFIERLHQLLQRTATWVAGSAAAFILAASSLIFAGPPQLIIWLLAGLCLVRARYAVEQMEAFAFAQHKRALRLVLPVVVGLLVCGALGVAQLLTLAFVVLTLGLTVVLDAYLRAPTSGELSQTSLLGLPAFFTQLERTEGKVFGALLTVDRRVTTRSLLARALTASYEGLVLTRVGASQLACYAPASSTASLPRLIATAPGALREVHVAAVCSTGADAAAALRRSHPLSPLFLPAHAQPLSALVAQFLRDFPQGSVVQLARLDQAPTSLTPAMQRALLQALFSTHGQTARASSEDCQVAVYTPGGQPETAFVVPTKVPTFANFNREVLRASLAAHA